MSNNSWLLSALPVSSAAIAAAEHIGATYHEGLVDDIDILYEKGLLAKVAAIIRTVAPDIILTHGPNEYMEDHCNTCRLTVTAAFTRGMPNHITEPRVAAYDAPVALYHSVPFSMTDPLCRPVKPHVFTDVSSTMDTKWEMLACHRSQKEWLDVSQGLDAYLIAMRENCRRIGQCSGRFEFAEGWFRHSPLGFCGPDHHPLQELLKEKCYDAPLE